MNIAENISLKDFNSFGIDVLARYFATFTSSEDLQLLLQDTRANNRLILGGGSNILFTKSFDGLILKNNLKGIELIKEDPVFVYVRAQAGENWHSFVQYCILHNYAGLENLSLIPGNVGASPIQNIGAYGVEIKDVFYELEAFHLRDHSIQKFDLADCEMGYRESVFKHRYVNQFVILNVTFRLRKNPIFNTSYGAIEKELIRMSIKELSILAISNAIINIRTNKLPDPAKIGNAGSFFKNPIIDLIQFEELKRDFPGIPGYPTQKNKIKIAAGWLIEACGWKGYRKADAGCYEKQALVLLNYGQATGEEIMQLSVLIIQSVYQKFKINIEREVNVV